MTMLRRYGEFPAVFVPDEGEVVLASRSPGGPFLRAAITKVRRASRDKIRIDFVWLEGALTSPNGAGHRPGEKGNVYISRDDPDPCIRGIPAGRD